MASPHSLTLTSTLILLFLSLSSATKPPSSTPSSYIKSSCSITRYPSLCVDSLSTYSSTIKHNNPKQIAQAALSVSLDRARSAQAYVLKMSRTNNLKGMVYQVVKDCIENMGDSVDRLSTSLGELGHMRGEGGEESFMWHMSNVQTWVSAALTDENTCIDGFTGRGLDGELKRGIRARVNGVARVTSNALALVNRFADRH